VLSSLSLRGLPRRALRRSTLGSEQPPLGHPGIEGLRIGLGLTRMPAGRYVNNTGVLHVASVSRVGYSQGRAGGSPNGLGWLMSAPRLGLYVSKGTTKRIGAHSLLDAGMAIGMYSKCRTGRSLPLLRDIPILQESQLS
jgi:hypothetical protein